MNEVRAAYEIKDKMIRDTLLLASPPAFDRDLLSELCLDCDEQGGTAVSCRSHPVLYAFQGIVFPCQVNAGVDRLPLPPLLPFAPAHEIDQCHPARVLQRTAGAGVATRPRTCSRHFLVV